ncbi:MAG: hypothetical protein FJ215_07295 [Ignavibacteria bacterium]|nr:hypothetical protein [Ignavibacteria bacterium]
MPEYQKHLYMIVYPINALVASQIPPEKFAEHYTIGSAKHFSGKVIFVELDINFRNPYFEIDKYLELTVAHADGTPKKTKFISSYAVLEHVDLTALRDLFLVTVNGKSLKISSAPYTAVNEPGFIRIYQEITPLGNLVASTLDQRSFGKFITSQTKSKGAPKIIFTQFELNVEEYLAQHQSLDMVQSPIPDVHPARLYNCLIELKKNPDKRTKTVGLNSAFFEASYRLIRHGFWFAAGEELLFYPMPSAEVLERDHYPWWKYTQ